MSCNVECSGLTLVNHDGFLLFNEFECSSRKLAGGETEKKLSENEETEKKLSKNATGRGCNGWLLTVDGLKDSGLKAKDWRLTVRRLMIWILGLRVEDLDLRA